MIGKVGDDTFGRLLIQTVKEAGIDTAGIVTDPDVFTTLAFVSLDASGNRDFSFARKPGADTCLTPGEVDESLIAGTRVFHFGTLSLTDEPAASATRRAVELAKARGLLVSLDPNLRKPLWKREEDAKAAIEWSLRQADIVKISDEEIEFLWGLTPEAGAQKLLDEYGVSLVYATLGPNGCHAATRNVSVTVGSPKGLDVIDTTGAGDIFGGSAMSRFLKLNKKPEEITEAELRDIVKISDEEIRWLWGLSPEEGARKLLREYGVSLVYATLGPEGCHAATRNAAVTVPSPKGIQVADTTGAGDIFGGSAMSRFLKTGKAPADLTEAELREIVRFACTAASLSTRKHGGISSIPSPEEVEDFLAR